MPQPTPYNRQFSFTNFQTVNPTASLPADKIDVEYNAIKQTLDATLANLALVQRDDGALANLSVGLEQLAPEVQVGISVPRVWTTATAYKTSPRDTVFNGSAFYRCLIDHTSGVFATDLAAGKWQLIVDLSTVPLVNASQIAFTPGGGLISTNVQTALVEAGNALTGKQPLDATLSALAAIATAANKLIYATGVDTFATTDLSVFGRSIIDDADASTALSTLGVSTYVKTLLDDVDAVTARATLGIASVVRERLLADRTYFVRPDGSDSNTGLADTAGAAFLTLQKAWNVIVQTLDLNGFTAKIKVADGTYTGGIRSDVEATGGLVRFEGNILTPANVIISETDDFCFRMQDGAKIYINGAELRVASSGSCLSASSGGVIYIEQAIRFGNSPDAHIQANRGGLVLALNAYSIVGVANQHLMAYQNGIILIADQVITLVGTPSFVRFAYAFRGGVIEASGCTFTGSATGSRFTLETGGVVFGDNATLTFFPGNAAGTVASSGVYDGKSALAALGSIGYTTGAGGTVTQLTNKSTGVTLNTLSGQITMNSATLNADTTVSFTLTNSQIAAGDILIMNHISGGTPGSYTFNARSAGGGAAIDVRNITVGNLGEAVVIAFAVIKAATA